MGHTYLLAQPISSVAFRQPKNAEYTKVTIYYPIFISPYICIITIWVLMFRSLKQMRLDVVCFYFDHHQKCRVEEEQHLCVVCWLMLQGVNYQWCRHGVCDLNNDDLSTASHIRICHEKVKYGIID